MSYYVIEVSHNGYYTDETLNKKVGRRNSGFSGYGMGERDIGWYFNTYKSASEAFCKLRSLKKLRKLSLFLEREE